MGKRPPAATGTATSTAEGPKAARGDATASKPEGSAAQKSEASEVPEAASVPIRPRWENPAVPGTYANFTQVVGNREEIMLLFSTNEAWQSDNPTPDVKLTNRIILTPYSAKRLAQMLLQGVREYEQRFGPIVLK